MDANGQRFWLIRGERTLTCPPEARLDADRGVLRLASLALRDLPQPGAASRESAASGPPGAVDAFGNHALVDADGRTVLGGGVHGEPRVVFRAAPGERVADLLLTTGGILHLALLDGAGGGRIVLRDAPSRIGAQDEPDDRPAGARRGRFDELELRLEGFAADRLAGDGPVHALDRAGRRLVRIDGRPMLRDAARLRSDATFRPRTPDPDPPRLVAIEGPALPEERQIVDLAAPTPGRLVLLLVAAGGEAELMVVEDGRAHPPMALNNRRPDGTLEPIRNPFALAAQGPARVVLLLSGWPGGRVPEAIPIDLDAGEPLLPSGQRYPLPGWAATRPLKGAGTGPRFRSGHAVRPIVRLALPGSAARALVDGGTRVDAASGLRHLDSGEAGFVWHRLHLEAALPPGTRLTVHLAAADTLDELARAPLFPHRFGGPAPDDEVPHAAWLPQASELPFHAGVLPCPRRPGESGLFTCLIQRAGMADRRLRGRHLRIRLELAGDGRASPEIAALRVWGPRFCYRDHYLPAHYREARPAAGEGPASGPDFLGRFLALFESLLTPLEDRVACAWRTTSPATAPAEALDWLAGWIGLTFDAALPEDRRRRMLAAAATLWRRRGTLAALEQALDLVTGGMVARGEIVALEHFRLRRTLATILGARLAPVDDPLLPGRHLSGNSVVGPSLVLGSAERRELLALLRAEQLLDAGEAEAVAAFLDAQAHRASVLVNREVDEQTLALVRRATLDQAPAHVEVRVVGASAPLILGLRSLLAVETLLRPRPARGEATLDAARLGRNTFLLGSSSLDPRLRGGEA